MKALLGCVLSASVVVFWQIPVAPAAEETAPANVINEARSHFRLGSAYYRGGAYDLALQEFEAAYKLDPRPDMLFNLGQCQRQLGHDREALALYRAFLRELPGSPRRAEVQSYVDELTKKIAAEEESGRKPVPAHDPAKDALVPLGESEPAQPPRTPGGPEAAPAAEPKSTIPPGALPAPPGDARASTLKRAGLGLGIGGLLVAAGGAALLGAAAADNNQLNHPEPGTMYDPGLEDRMNVLKNAGFAAVGVGLAAGVAGTVMYVIGTKRPAALSATARGATFQLAWEF